MLKYCIYISFFLFISCEKIKTVDSNFLVVQFDPSYVPYDVDYDLKSPFFYINKDTIAFINKNGQFYSGKLTNEELTDLKDTLSTIGFFGLNNSQLMEKGFDKRGAFGMHGTLVKVYSNFDNNSKQIEFGRYIKPDFEMEDCLYEDWYCDLIFTLSGFDSIISEYEFMNMKRYKGPVALHFTPNSRATSIFSNSTRRWPFDNITPSIDSLYSYKNEVVVSESQTLKKIHSDSLFERQLFAFKEDTFRVLSRPIFDYE